MFQNAVNPVHVFADFTWCKAVITQKYTLNGIRYTLYDLLSATDDIQVM